MKNTILLYRCGVRRGEASPSCKPYGLQGFCLRLSTLKCWPSCHNPSIGGSAKGIVVREVDALGGEMAKTIDETYIQMKMLNH